MKARSLIIVLTGVILSLNAMATSPSNDNAVRKQIFKYIEYPEFATDVELNTTVEVTFVVSNGIITKVSIDNSNKELADYISKSIEGKSIEVANLEEDKTYKIDLSFKYVN